jgi:hypothetical protein
MLLGTTAVLALSFGASVASADALRQAGFPVPLGFVMNMTSPAATFTGVLGPPITCTSATFGSTVTQNNILGPVKGTVTGLTWAGCTQPGPPPVPCTVVANGLPWPNAMRILNGPPKRFDLFIPPLLGITITCGGIVCTYSGAAALPPNSVPAVWTDSPPPPPPNPATVTFAAGGLAGVAPSNAACGPAAAYTSTYTTTLNDLTITP